MRSEETDTASYEGTRTTTVQPADQITSATEVPSYMAECPSNVVCSDLGAECIDCDLANHTECVYGSKVNVSCRVKPEIVCIVSNITGEIVAYVILGIYVCLCVCVGRAEICF